MGLIVVIGATAAAQVRLNAWNKPFFDAIERRDVDAFVFQLFVFGLIAGGLLILNVAQTWLDQMIKVHTREWLTRDLFTQWMVSKRAFLIAGAGNIGIPDQRIHEDARSLTDLSAALAIGFFQSMILLVSFIGVLWVLSRDCRSRSPGKASSSSSAQLWAT